MMTTATMPQMHCTSTLAQPQLGIFGNAIASTPSSGTTPSSLCSTPVTMLNPNFPPLVQYVQPAAYPYPQPTIAPPAPLMPPVTNIFEGVPIFLVPQNGLGSASVPLSALQRVSDGKANWNPQPQPAKPDTSKHFHVFVGDLATEVDSAALKTAFATYGEISEAKVIRDPQTMKSKGYGFVSFPAKENAEKAIEAMNGQTIGRRQIRTNWATRKPTSSEDGSVKEQTFDEIFNATRANNTSVYVGNISPSSTDNDIRDAFSACGTISEVRVFKQQGYGFVRFSNKEEAAKAIMAMSGKDLKGQTLRCSWGRNPVENNTVASQTLNCLNFMNTNLAGINPLFNPVSWNQNHFLTDFYNPAILQPYQA